MVCRIQEDLLKIRQLDQIISWDEIKPDSMKGCRRVLVPGNHLQVPRYVIDADETA